MTPSASAHAAKAEWELAEIPVAARFESLVGTLFFLHLPAESQHRLSRVIAMATPSVDLLMNLGDPFTLETFWEAVPVAPGPHLVGPRPATAFLRCSGEVFLLGARFKYGAVASLLPYPVKELEQRVVPLANLWPEAARALTGAGDRRTPVRSLVHAMEKALDPLMERGKRPDPMVRKAVRLIAQAHGDLEVSAMAEALGVSRQTVKHKFDQHVGVSPKLFGKLRRFQAVLKRLAVSPKADWAELAKASGYYDQAHLTREFNHFTGFSPQKFVKNLAKGEDLYLFDSADQTRFHLGRRTPAERPGRGRS